MFNKASITCSIICLTLTLSGAAHGQTTASQQLSPAILRAIPRVVERLQSGDIHERISVLDELVTQQRGVHLSTTVLPYQLPASDYLIVVQSILAGNLAQLDEQRSLATWWRLNYVAREFKLREVIRPLTGYLATSSILVQFDIVRTLRTLGAIESAPEIAKLLQSPDKSVRRETLETLVSLRAKEANPTLLALLNDKDADQRRHAMFNLIKVNDRDAVPSVAKILDDEDDRNRYWALDALVNLKAREHAPAIWKLTEAGEQPQTQVYALAALISFGERRAIPLAVARMTVGDLSPRTRMLEFLVQVKANAIAPALVDVLESRTVLGGNPTDIGTDSNIRRDIMTCLGKLEAREAIPVLRSYARGRESNTFLQRAAVMTLGVFRAKESVNDLLPMLDPAVTGDEYATAEAAVALAQIGERTTFRKLIELAARPSCPYRSEIISELNRHVDRELWDRIQTQNVRGVGIKSVKTMVESFSRDSGIRIVLDYRPGRDSSPRAPLAGDEYPWANLGAESISLSYCLTEIIDGLSDGRTPRTFTFILDDKQIHIVSVERAIEWWRKQI